MLLTGFDENIVLEEKLKFGIDNVLTKPVLKKKLLITLYKFLN